MYLNVFYNNYLNVQSNIPVTVTKADKNSYLIVFKTLKVLKWISLGKLHLNSKY